MGDASSAAAIGPGEVTGASNLLESPTAPEGRGTSPRVAAMVPDKKRIPEHGGEARNTSGRSVGPGAATHRKNSGDPRVASLGVEDEYDGESTGRSKKSSAPRAAPPPEEENPEQGGTRSAADGRCSGGERAQNGDIRGTAPAAVPLDAPVGGSDAVLVQPGLAAAPAGGSGNVRDSSSRGRPRRLVRRKKKHTADPLILPPYERRRMTPLRKNMTVKFNCTKLIGTSLLCAERTTSIAT